MLPGCRVLPVLPVLPDCRCCRSYLPPVLPELLVLPGCLPPVLPALLFRRLVLIVGTGISLAVIGGVGFLIGTFIGIRLGGAYGDDLVDGHRGDGLRFQRLPIQPRHPT